MSHGPNHEQYNQPADHSDDFALTPPGAVPYREDTVDTRDIRKLSNKEILDEHVSKRFQARMSPQGRRFLARVIRASGGGVYVDKVPEGFYDTDRDGDL